MLSLQAEPELALGACGGPVPEAKGAPRFWAGAAGATEAAPWERVAGLGRGKPGLVVVPCPKGGIVL